MHSFFRRFKRFSMRTRAIIAIVLVFVLLASGVFTILVQIGKLGTRADTSIKTIIVTGKYTNAITGKVVVGAKINIQPRHKNDLTVSTNTYGIYKATFTIDTGDPAQKNINIRQYMTNYPQDGNGTEFDRVVPDSTSSTITITQNFKLAPIPQDIVSTAQLDPTSMRCRTSPSKFDYKLDYYHTGDYKGQLTNGVLFCVTIANQSFFTNSTYQIDIDRTAVQINSLVARTNLEFTPTIYLSGPLTWDKLANGSTPAAYTPKGAQEILIDIKSLNDLTNITHEFGHLVDWGRGPDMPVDTRYCFPNIAKTKTHCSLSDLRYDFVDAASISGYQKFITGYATSGREEMFAEMFAFQQMPDSAGSTHFSDREYTQYDIVNALLGDYSNSFGVTSIELPTTQAGQNAAMYVYKFVASAGNLDEYFPGTLGNNWSYNDIWYGKYMDKGVVSIALYKCDFRCNDNTPVTIGGISASMRSEKKSGVFSDGSGDLFDTTGTAVLMSVPTSTQSISVSGFSSTNVNPNTKAIIAGSNPVICLDANGKLGFNYSSQIGSYGTGNGQFQSIVSLATDPYNGKLFVLDDYSSQPAIDNSTEDRLSRIEIFDNNGKYLSQFGQGKIYNSASIAIDKNGFIYVVSFKYTNYKAPTGGSATWSTTQNKVLIFKNDGTYVSSIGLTYNPLDIATDPATGELYVLTANGRGINVYYTNHSLFRSFAFSAYSADRIAINSQHDVYAADPNNKVVRRYDTFGKYWNQQILNSDGKVFTYVTDINIDNDDRIFVTDFWKNIQVFDSNRNYLTQITGNIAASAVVDGNDRIFSTNQNGLISKFDPFCQGN